METRPLEVSEYKEIIKLLNTGFSYKVNNQIKQFRPNPQVALILQLEASLGLRVGDVLELKLSNFRNGKLETRERKTGKLQYREVNVNIINAVYDYAIRRNKDINDNIFDIGVRAVQKQLKIITDYLDLDNIGTHSFRKLYAVTVYDSNDNNIELVKELLNHTSLVTTQRYIRVNQKTINQASRNINYIID